MVSPEGQLRQLEASARTNQLRSERAEQRFIDAAKRCLKCGNLIPRNPRLRVAINLKQKHCGRTCASVDTWINYRAKVAATEMPAGQILLAKYELKRKGEVAAQNIRAYARAAYAKLICPNPSCEVCGYNRTTTDIAHIRAVADFPNSATVAEINQLSNLISLCKNCHTEFDRGILPIEVINKKVAERILS